MGNSGLVQRRRNDGRNNFSIAKCYDTRKDSFTIYGHTPLHYAVSMREYNAVADVVSNGAAFINSKDFLGRTALHYAIGECWLFLPTPVVESSCDIEIVEMLLSNPDLDLNPKDNAGETPLMWAVKIGNLEAVGVLLRKGADPDIPNNDNRTPLHEALSAQYPGRDIIVLSLLTYGAGIYRTDNFWQTPIDILVRKVCDHQTLSFAKTCARIIAFRCRIGKSLQHKLERIPALSEYFKICCEEVGRMHRHVIYDKITVHDFITDCFQCRGRDPIEDIYKAVVEFLLSRSCYVYVSAILHRVPEVDLHDVLKETAGKSLALNLLPPNPSHLDILYLFDRFLS